MNVPYYLTIEKGLVHFGSEVRKISYTFLNMSVEACFTIVLSHFVAKADITM